MSELEKAAKEVFGDEIGGQENHDEYTIRIPNSDEFSRMYNIISNNKDYAVQDGSLTTPEHSQFTFTDGYINIETLAMFDKDIYKIIISRR